MQLNILKKNALEQLKSDISQNMKKYADEKVWIDKYFSDKSELNYYRSTGLAVPDVELKPGGPETDAENAATLYDALKDTLNPRLAADLRFWAYLTHKDFYTYMVKRWPIEIPDQTDETKESASSAGKQYSRINTRYFFGASNGKAFVRQGIARLYWSAVLTYDADNSDPYEMTRYFLSKQDCFVAATERTLARNKTFLLAALRVLKEYGDISRADTRAYFAEVNRACGIEVLDALSSYNAYDLCKRCLDYVMSLPAIKAGSKIKVKMIDSGQNIPMTVDEHGTYLGKSLLRTSPKSIIGLKPGSRFSYRKSRVKVVSVDNG